MNAKKRRRQEKRARQRSRQPQVGTAKLDLRNAECLPYVGGKFPPETGANFAVLFPRDEEESGRYFLPYEEVINGIAKEILRNLTPPDPESPYEAGRGYRTVRTEDGKLLGLIEVWLYAAGGHPVRVLPYFVLLNPHRNGEDIEDVLKDLDILWEQCTDRGIDLFVRLAEILHEKCQRDEPEVYQGSWSKNDGIVQ